MMVLKKDKNSRTKSLALIAAFIVCCLPQASANNFIPELTVDGVEKTFRVTGPETGTILGSEVTSVGGTSSQLDTTIVLTFEQPVAGSVTYNHTIDETGVYDTGWTNSSGISRTPSAPYLELERIYTFGITETSSGSFTLEMPFGPDSTVAQTTENTLSGSFESVTVEAGTFENVLRLTRVETQILSSLLGPQETVITSQIWMANGVGVVKTAIETVTQTPGLGSETESSSTELVSYNIPGNLSTGAPTLENGGSGIALYNLDNPNPGGNGSTFARPEGWHYTVGGYEWSNTGQFWYWIPPGPPQVVNLSTGDISLRPINGWNFYNWPYFYNANQGNWFYVFQSNLPSVLNLETNQWRRWGQQL